jgi:signal peptidase II
MKRIFALGAIALILIVADQVSKAAIVDTISYGDSIIVIDGFFNLAHVRNTGAAFGIGRSQSRGIDEVELRQHRR